MELLHLLVKEVRIFNYSIKVKYIAIALIIAGVIIYNLVILFGKKKKRNEEESIDYKRLEETNFIDKDRELGLHAFKPIHVTKKRIPEDYQDDLPKKRMEKNEVQNKHI